MKTLYLFRHAKSDWSDPSLDDFDRPLAARGKNAAPRMGRALRGQRPKLDLVLCSAARRARETWELIRPEMAEDVPVKVMRSLYLAPPSRLLTAIRRVAEPVRSVLLIGHNPGMQNLALSLSGPLSKPEALGQLDRKYPTAALATIVFDAAGWREIGEQEGRLIYFLRPKDNP